MPEGQNSTRQPRSEITRRYREAHPDRVKASQLRCLSKHPELRKKWKTENPERVNELARLAYERDPKAQAARTARYKERFPERVRQQKRDAAKNGSARRRGAEGRFTKEDIQLLFVAQKGKCAEPSCKVKLDKYHVDHVMPLSRGGTNWPDNLQLLCPSCNLRKHRRDPYEWARINGRLF